MDLNPGGALRPARQGAGAQVRRGPDPHRWRGWCAGRARGGVLPGEAPARV